MILVLKNIFICLSVFVFLQQSAFAVEKQDQTSKSADQKLKTQAYSFRPLLIQGKKQLVKKAKDLKVKDGKLNESEIFYIEMDFKKRIFE